MPDIGTMHQLNPEPPHIGTMHQLGPEPLHTGEIITPQAQAEEYAREAQESADNAALSAAAAQSAAETAQQAAESIAPALDEKAAAIHTAAGPAPIVSIPDAAAAPVDALTVGIEPVQDLHGYDNPWPAGGGKNLLQNNLTNGTNRGITFTKNDDGTVTISGTNDGTSYSKRLINNFQTENGVQYVLSGGISSSVFIRDVTAAISAGASAFQFTGDGTEHTIEIRVIQDTAISGSVVVKPMICLASAQNPDVFAPYSNICPISGWTGAKVYHSGEDTSNPTEIDITFPTEAGTVYGGSLNVTTGVLTVDRAQIASYNGETLPGEWISDRDVYAQGTTPTTGAQVVYELATPITYQLTPQEVRTLLGTNNIWADTGDVTVGYKADTKLYIDKKFAELQALILEQ